MSSKSSHNPSPDKALKKDAIPFVAVGNSTLAAPEVFIALFRQAIDRGVSTLAEAGVEDAVIWSSYRSALNVIVQTTLDVDADKRAIAA